MEKSLIVRFRVEDEDLPDLLKRLFLISCKDDASECLAVIEDFYVPISSTYFDDFGLSPVKSVARDPKSGWPVND